MRLLILNYEYPPLGGGAGRCSKYQAEGLAGLGYEVCVITTWFTGEAEREERDHFRLIRLRSRRKKIFRSNPMEMTSWALHASRYIRKHDLHKQTDLVLAHFSLPGGMVALPLDLSHGLPYMIISHGQDIPWFSPRELFLYHLVFYLPIRWICSRASLVSVLSQRRLRDLKNLTSSKHHAKYQIIPNGCDIDFFSPSVVEKDPSELRMVFAGRLTRQKDPFTLLRTARSLLAARVPFSIEILGDGPLRRKMESYVKQHQLEGSVHFAGWVTREVVREKYRRAHLLLVTSRDEGQSLTMMEALATGLYLFTTPVSGSEFLIQEGVNGTFIPEGDPEAIAGMLSRHFREKIAKRYRIPEETLQSLRESISWDGYIMAYHRIIQTWESST